MKTAVAIKELQQSLPGERFTKLDQLKSISGVDWDVVLETPQFVPFSFVQALLSEKYWDDRKRREIPEDPGVEAGFEYLFE